MEEIEQENVTYKESLDQFQGKMDTILKFLRTQKDNAITTVGTPVEIETATQSIPNQSGSLCISSGHATFYPWWMAQNFIPQVANGGSFVPYQLVPLPPINGNVAIDPWGMPSHFSPSVNVVDKNKAPQD